MIRLDQGGSPAWIKVFDPLGSRRFTRLDQDVDPSGARCLIGLDQGDSPAWIKAFDPPGSRLFTRSDQGV
ncbi:MAG: hypothetical protein LBD58_12225 [Treponema sp.]|nr:hypothetical protein [Treponema sp.]